MKRIRGIYSTESVDRDNEVVVTAGIAWNDLPLPLLRNHKRETLIGSVDKLWVDDANQAWFEGDLYEETGTAVYPNLGGIFVRDAPNGDKPRRIVRVLLLEISLSPVAVNPDIQPYEEVA